MLSRIRIQTILLSVIPLLFLVVLLALALGLYSGIGQAASDAQHSAGVLNQSDRVFLTLGVASRSVVDYASKHNPSLLSGYYKSVKVLPGQLKTFADLVRGEPDQEVRVARLTTLMTAGIGVLDEYVRDLRSGQAAKAKALGESAHTRAISTGLESTDAAINAAERAMTIARFNGVRNRLSTFGFAMVLVAFIGILLTLFIAAQFGLRITHRLERLADNARRLWRGEEVTPIGGSDEIAALDGVYQEMMERIKREHHVASTLQHALLPQELPKVPGLRIDAAYVSAARGTIIGGDWYDVFALSDRCIGIGVGDVAGHGLRAAAVMGEVRQAIRTAARIDRDPALVLQHVNAVLCADEDDVVVTAFFGLLDMSDGILRYAIAGHPPPMVVRPNGTVEQLIGGGFVLGVDPDAKYEEFRMRLEVGAGFVLYTDGVVENERDYFKGIDGLTAAIEAEYRNASDNIAQAIMRRALARTEPRDDSAVLFIGITSLERIAPPEKIRTWVLDAKTEASMHGVKRALMWHLGEITAKESDLGAVELILGELVSNVARHTPGPAEVTLECDVESAVLHVCDRGKPFDAARIARPEPMQETGRGLFIVREIARELTVEQTDRGNRISAVLPIALA